MDARDRPLAHSANVAGHTHDLERHLRDVALNSADFALQVRRRSTSHSGLACGTTWANITPISKRT